MTVKGTLGRVLLVDDEEPFRRAVDAATHALGTADAFAHGMPYASYVDSPHRGLPIPMWLLIVGTVLSAILAVVLVAQTHQVRPVHRLAEPITVPTR